MKTKIQRALISVSDKQGIVEFAQQLVKHGVDLLSTGGTASLLQAHHIPVTEISDYTGFPEMMAGRVKTLHPKIHGGLLGRRDTDHDVMQQHDIAPIDLVVVNLYPFTQTIAKADCTLDQAIENIDIGGPAMLRSAAKNHDRVTVVTDTADYAAVLQAIEHGGTEHALRFKLAAKVFQHTAEYDGAIASYLGRHLQSADQPAEQPARYSQYLNLNLHKRQDLRYGENPHQQAAFYVEPELAEASLATAEQHQGKALSFNNIADSNAALECVKQFAEPACVVVKHANPCGVAVAGSIHEAYEQAYQTDPTSAFGGIIAFNQTLDAATAQAIVDRQFVEVILAPSAEPEALTVTAAKKNIRVLTTGQWQSLHPAQDYQRVTGGLLVQDRDLGQISINDLQVVTEQQPSDDQLQDLLFAWRVAKFVKSNAIVYAREQQTIGIGAGQMSRVYSARIASIKAADENLMVAGSVMASDAFFPFRDGIDAAHEAGIKAVIQPGGSMRDEEVIQAANEHGMAMIFTRMRHFRH